MNTLYITKQNIYNIKSIVFLNHFTKYHENLLQHGWPNLKAHLEPSEPSPAHLAGDA